MRRLEILCAVPQPTGLRVDRLLAAELHWSRSRIQRLEKAGELVVLPAGSRLRRAVRDGTRLVIDFSQASDCCVAVAARSVRGGLAGSE
jgi:hypothetical protein